MTSPPLDSTRSRQRRVWHDITVVGQHTRSNDIECDMTSPPLDSTHGQMTSGVACHHRLWTAYTVEWRRMWHAIIAFGQHTGSNNVRSGMPSSTLGNKNGRTLSDVACHHRRWTSSHSRTVSGVACHHRLWTPHTVKRRRAWHAIIAFGKHKRSKDVACGVP